jgi:hypothetical protein
MRSSKPDKYQDVGQAPVIRTGCIAKGCGVSEYLFCLSRQTILDGALD